VSVVIIVIIIRNVAAVGTASSARANFVRVIAGVAVIMTEDPFRSCSGDFGNFTAPIAVMDLWNICQ
jgi:hypothetical protein